MPTYQVICSWRSWGHHFVEATTFEEAKRKALDLPLPEQGEYIDDSLLMYDDDIEEVPSEHY